MALFDIVMPRLGEGITEATITRWLKKEGDPITEEEALVEIATDKVDSEIPSPVNGIVKEFLYNEGDVVEVDNVIARIEYEGPDTQIKSETQKKSDYASQQEHKATVESQSKTLSIIPEVRDAVLSDKEYPGRYLSPLVRNIAREEQISEKELMQIPGTGKDGRLTKDDVLDYLRDRQPKTHSKDPVASQQQNQNQQIVSSDQIIEMSRLRKLIMQNMVDSVSTSVHVTSVIEIDVTNLVKWREKFKESFETREKEKLTFTPLIIRAIALSLKDYPMLNSSVSGEKIIIHKDINIGMAVALPDGNLIVPVIRNADHKSLLGLTKSVNDLAKRSRTNKLKPDEVLGGTFTLTNVGSFDTLFATPIINQPQVAILAAGAIKKKPIVLETQHGDTIAIRSMMYLSLSYDHRVIDGALGGLALKRIGEYLQNWESDTAI